MLASHVQLPRPRSAALPIRWLRALWTAPTNAVGWAACRVLSGQRGVRVGGAAARGWIYPVRRGIGLDWIGAVTLGHHILYLDGMFEGPRGRLVLAHELAHTRQHDWLGPLYLPLHVVAQAVSVLISLLQPGRPVHSRVHDHNPLEQTFITLAAGATDAWPEPATRAGLTPDKLLSAFDV